MACDNPGGKESGEGKLRSIRIIEGPPAIRRVIVHLQDEPLSPSAEAFGRVIETVHETETESL